MFFGQTELKVTAHDITTGAEQSTSIAFSSSEVSVGDRKICRRLLGAGA
jgi:hypothetical protein